MRHMDWKKLLQINWRAEANIIPLTIEQFEAKKQEVITTMAPALSNNDRLEWENGMFKIDYKGYWGHIFVRENDRYNRYVCHTFNDDINLAAQQDRRIDNIGARCNKIEQRIFKELNGVSERQAFGYSEPFLNMCVPKQLYYYNSRWELKKIGAVSMADFSSHYPANMCGRMPTWNKCKQLDGTHKPTREYPFAFYIVSGHSAELGTYDTHEWLDEDLAGDLFGKNYKATPLKEDRTILCRPSKYTFDSTVNLLYNAKLRGELIDDIPAKTIINASIGYKHLRGEFNRINRLYHVAAVTIARANQRMIDLYHEYSRSILQIIVDSVIYMGAQPIGQAQPELGALVQKITGKSFIMRGCNQYMFRDADTGTCPLFAHSGFNDRLLTNSLEDIKLWQRR